MQANLDWLNKNHTNLVKDLADLVAVRSVSTDGEHQKEVEQSAELTREQMRRAGLQKTEVLRCNGSNPYAYGEWLGAAGKPTVFLYAHHDVQPVHESDLDAGRWHSDPWKLTARDGRLYGRGSRADAALALNVILAKLYWDNGRLPIPHYYDSVCRPTAAENKTFRSLPGSEEKWREDTGVLPGVRLAMEKGGHPHDQTWRKPAVTIIAQEASSLKGASNQVLPRAQALVSCRIVPDQGPQQVFEQVRAYLSADPPWGVKGKVEPHGSFVKWWMTDPNGPAFEAAR